MQIHNYLYVATQERAGFSAVIDSHRILFFGSYYNIEVRAVMFIMLGFLGACLDFLHS
jgi:hypothetical protein